jgi:hypothetical protein
MQKNKLPAPSLWATYLEAGSPVKKQAETAEEPGAAIVDVGRPSSGDPKPD